MTTQPNSPGAGTAPAIAAARGRPASSLPAQQRKIPSGAFSAWPRSAEEQAASGRLGQAAAAQKLAAYRAQLSAVREARDERVLALRDTTTRADMATQLGCSLSQVNDSLARLNRIHGKRPSYVPGGGARQAARADVAARLREFVARHDCTVAEAARGIGVGVSRATDIAKACGIKASAAALSRAYGATTPRRLKRQAKARRAEAKGTPSAPNPKLSPAQQTVVAEQKAASWARYRPAHTYVPPPANADELIRQAIAEGRVTKCPARCVAPVNNGMGL